MRSGQPEQAQEQFTRALAEPQLGPTARYYLGVLAFEGYRLKKAQSEFEQVQSEKPNSELAAQSQLYLDAIEQAKQDRYRIYASTGYQYDSNVGLLNDLLEVQQPDGENRADSRLVLQAGGSGVVWENESTYALAGYDFFQSLHAELDQYDVQDHRVWSELVHEAAPWTFDLGLAWDYYLLDQSSFVDQLAGIAAATFQEGDWGESKLFYQLRKQNFRLDPFDGTTLATGDKVGVRDALIHTVGLRQYWNLDGPQNRVYAGYAWESHDADENDPQAQAFAYQGNHGQVGLEWDLPAGIEAAIEIEYRQDRYDADSAEFSLDSQGNGNNKRREDDELRGIVALRKRLNDRFSATISYIGSDNDSKDERFDYTRHIGSVSVEAELW